MSNQSSVTKSVQIALVSQEKAQTQNEVLQEYLELVFKGLLASQQRRKVVEEGKLPDQKPCSISRSLFHRFTSLPLILSKKLFKSFSNEAGELDMISFVNGFVKLVLGSPAEKIRIVFDLLNLEAEHSDLLKENDARALSYHISVASRNQLLNLKLYRSEKYQKSDHSSDTFLRNIESALESLFANGSKAFRGCRSIDFKTFSRFSSFIESDLVHLVLTFIYDRTHLLDKVRIYHKSFDLLVRENEAASTSSKLITSEASFYQLDQISHVQHLRAHPLIRQAYKPSEDTQASLTPKQDGYTESLLSLLTFRSCSDKVLSSAHEAQENIFVKRSKSHQVVTANVKGIKHSGLVYRFVKEKVIRPFWFELRGSDLYVFKIKGAPKPKMIISLFSGFFLVNKPESELSLKDKDFPARKLYSFELVFPNGAKKEFLFFDQKEQQQWFSALERILPDFIVQEHYELTEAYDISDEEMSFKGFSIITGESVKITEIAKNKSGASFEAQSSYEEALIERIEILRACSHPLITRVKDIHETLDYYYIIQQDQESIPLVDYFQSTDPNLEEGLRILEQLTEILSFTKKMGVLIGNLIPPSFELCESTSRKSGGFIVKLSDLSQARLINPNKRTTAIMDTSLFSAPEIHNHKSLGFEADAFSLGVILSCILFDCLPFESSEEVLSSEPRIDPPSESSGTPVILHNLVKKLLSKDEQKRTTIEGILKVTSLL